MKKMFPAFALALALATASATAPLAEGREANMSKQQIRDALVSTQSSGPGSAASASASARGSVGPALLMTIVVVAVLTGALRGTGYYHSY